MFNKKNHSAKNAKSPFVLPWSISSSSIFRRCSKHSIVNVRHHILLKSLERFPASKRLFPNSSETRELKERISHCSQENWFQTAEHSSRISGDTQLSRTCKYSTQWITQRYYKGVIGTITEPEGFIFHAGKFSATTKDANVVVLMMIMDAITYYVVYFPILSSNYFDNIYTWVRAIHWKVLSFSFKKCFCIRN